jgi:hypothetical protein
MKKAYGVILSALFITTLVATTATACIIKGKVACPNDKPFGSVTITVTAPAGQTPGTMLVTTTAANGTYEVDFTSVVAGTYTVTISDLPSGIIAADTKYSLDGGPLTLGTSVTLNETEAFVAVINWVIDGPACGSCWLTGGGAYFDMVTSTYLATHGGNKAKPIDSFGGNVYPGCSATAGDGGNWNHVRRGAHPLHFHGTSISVVQCGNVPGFDGSSSPVTPWSFIEFTGIGTLKGIAGNKDDFGIVHFYGRAEDRNEPGSKGASAGALIDRYYLRVWNDTGTLLEFADDTATGTAADDTNAAALVLPITSGNLQLHASSCDNPPAP